MERVYVWCLSSCRVFVQKHPLSLGTRIFSFVHTSFSLPETSEDVCHLYCLFYVCCVILFCRITKNTAYTYMSPLGRKGGSAIYLSFFLFFTVSRSVWPSFLSLPFTHILSLSTFPFSFHEQHRRPVVATTYSFFSSLSLSLYIWIWRFGFTYQTWKLHKKGKGGYEKNGNQSLPYLSTVSAFVWRMRWREHFLLACWYRGLKGALYIYYTIFHPYWK